MKIFFKKVVLLIPLIAIAGSLSLGLATARAQSQQPAIPPLNTGLPSPTQEAKSSSANLDCGWGNIGDCFLGGIKNVFLGIAYVIGLLGSKVLQLMAGLYNFAIQQNFKILENGNFIINAGFRTSLSVVNLGFVLAIILMAFSWILGIESYSGKKMLFKLVTAALLVNFSLLIVGVFLDFSHVIATSFIGGDPATTIVKTFNPQKILALKDGDFRSGSDFWVDLMSRLQTSVFQGILTWVIAITLGGLAIMVVGRYIILSILIVTMPFAWLFTVLPKYEKIHSEWWSKFLGQVFFLPAVSFFVYLAIGTYSNIDPSKGGIDQIASAFEQGNFVNNSFQYALQTIAFVALLWGGMIAAAKIGDKAGSAGIGFAGYLKNTALGKNKTLNKGLAAGAAGAGVVAGKGTRVGLSRLSRKIGLSGIADRLSGVSNKDKVETYRKGAFGKMNDEQLRIAAKKSYLDPVHKAALLAELTAKKKLDYLPKDNWEDYGRVAMAQNPGTSSKDIEAIKLMGEKNPELAGKLLTDTDIKRALEEDETKTRDAAKKSGTAYTPKTKTEQDAVIESARQKAIVNAAKKLDAEKAKDLSEEALRKTAIAGSLSDVAAKGVIQSGNLKKLKALKEGLEAVKDGASASVKDAKHYDDELRDLKKQLQDAKDRNNNNKIDDIKNKQKAAEERKKLHIEAMDEKDRNDFRAIKNLHTIEQTIAGIDD